MRPEVKVRHDDTQEDYAIFGKIVLLWGLVEEVLADITLTLSFPPLGLNNPNGVPHAFAKKCELAIRGFESIPAMHPIRDEAISTIKALRPLHAKRSIIVHGRFQGLSINGYLFTIYNAKKKRWDFENFTTDETYSLTREIHATVEMISRVARETSNLRAEFNLARLASLRA